MADLVKEKKKIGILTFHWADDFGAMLQAYGLKYTLEDMDCKVDVVPYANRNLVGRYWLFCWIGERTDTQKKSGRWNKSRSKSNLKNFSHFHRKRRAMKQFRRKFLTTKAGKSRERFLKLKKYDAIVIGSDQVWNPEITVGIDSMYFGNFAKKSDAKTIAYAASLGKERLEPEDGKHIGALLDKNFDFVSVRENSSIPFLKEYSEKDILAMPDPTLLCNCSVWEKLTCNPGVAEPFVLFHTTETNEEMLGFAKGLCEKHGLKFINARELAIGPSGFLWLVEHAEYVVTNSFHCLVYSILFHKCFFIFSHSNKNARLKDLLENTGLTDRIAEHFTDEIALQEPDWAKVDACLLSLQSKGKAFLETVLGEKTDEG